jgi:hypothetical protein
MSIESVIGRQQPAKLLEQQGDSISGGEVMPSERLSYVGNLEGLLKAREEWDKLGLRHPAVPVEPVKKVPQDVLMQRMRIPCRGDILHGPKTIGYRMPL